VPGVVVMNLEIPGVPLSSFLQDVAIEAIKRAEMMIFFIFFSFIL
jgi:hypothetical protein